MDSPLSPSVGRGNRAKGRRFAAQTRRTRRCWRHRKARSGGACAPMDGACGLASSEGSRLFHSLRQIHIGGTRPRGGGVPRIPTIPSGDSWQEKRDVRPFAPCRPPEYSASLLGPEASPPRGRPLMELAGRSEFFAAGVSPSWVRRSRCAVGPVLGCAVFRFATGPVTVKQPTHPLFGFCLPLESCPTMPSRSAAAERRLSWTLLPYSTSGLGDPLAAGFACPLRCAFRVWLPS